MRVRAIAAFFSIVVVAGEVNAGGWVRRPRDPGTDEVRETKEQPAEQAGGAVAFELKGGQLSDWAFATKKAKDLRKAVLDNCYLIYSPNFSQWVWTGILPKAPIIDWHVLGGPSCTITASGATQHITTTDEMDTVWAGAIGNDIRLIAETHHPEESVLITAEGRRLSDEEIKTVQKTAADFVKEEARSHSFRALLPAFDDYTSQAFFGKEDLQFLREVRASGWGDRISVTTELVADRLGYGRLALSGAFAGSNATGGAPALADGTDPKKNNVQKFFDNGGDLSLTYEVPILYFEKKMNTPGFGLLSILPRIVTVAPGLGSSIQDASFAFEPGARVYLQLQGFENSMGVFADAWAGWAIGIGPHFAQYLDERHFFVTTLTMGLRIFDRFTIGAGYIVAGPLAGRNGITLNVAASTSPNH